MFKKPNFFIIGAPKCGTTSLAMWLSEHPNVFMPKIKELDYFDFDRRKGYADDLARYERFFADVRDEHLAIGEASTGYLRSRVAVDEILKYSPEARFIVGLRNPVEMAISWHRQAVFEAWEDVLDFETAWRLQEARRSGQHIPRLCPDVSNLLYAEVCALGSQLARLYEKVPRDRVFIYTLDEMRSDPRSLWIRVQEFLKVPDDGRQHFPTYNQAKHVPKILRIVTRIVVDIKRNLGIYYGLGILNRMNKIFARKPVENVSRNFLLELYAYFRPEVELLQVLTGRDLSTWLRPLAEGNKRSSQLYEADRYTA